VWAKAFPPSPSEGSLSCMGEPTEAFYIQH
jgi:hypothetical protein